MHGKVLTAATAVSICSSTSWFIYIHFLHLWVICHCYWCLIAGSWRDNLHEQLDIQHLSEILEDFFDAREKWYYFGLHLKLKDITLQSIKASEEGIEDRFTAVLRKLLEGNGCYPITRSHLVEALEAKKVGLPKLARDLRKRYSTTSPGDLHVKYELQYQQQLCKMFMKIL